MLQQIIQLVTILFLLSMVCERIADFLKHYLCGSEFFGIGDTITKSPGDDIKEQARAYRILKINVWCGILTALILKADMIKIFNHIENPGETIGWSTIVDYGKLDSVFLVPGIFLTGCFISFGSKFWHDLLDILYQAKNAKRVLADPETYKIDKIDTQYKRLDIYPSDYISEAYLLAKQELYANPNVKAVSQLYNQKGYYYFELTLKTADTSAPTSYRYEPQKGGPVTIPISTVVLGDDDIIPHSINLGNKIANSKAISNYGTLGCMVTKNGDSQKQHYILTCYHNVVNPGSKFEFTKDTIDTISPDMPDAILGNVVYAIRDYEIDAALILIDPAQANNIVNDLPDKLGRPQKTRRLTNSDVEQGLFAVMCGATSGNQYGTVVSVYTNIKVKYLDKEHELLNVIAISKNGKAISQKGDSGGCIVDQDNNLLGILVAGNERTSYAIPATTLFAKLDVSLVTT